MSKITNYGSVYFFPLVSIVCAIENINWNGWEGNVLLVFTLVCFNMMWSKYWSCTDGC